MRIIYTTQSYRSLERIISFLKEKSSYTDDDIRALRDRLFNKGDSLANNPRIGQYETELVHLGKGHRRVIEGHFKIVYFIEIDTIYITDFFDTRQDPSKMKG